jgi:hypothetical protein
LLSSSESGLCQFSRFPFGGLQFSCFWSRAATYS